MQTPLKYESDNVSRFNINAGLIIHRIHNALRDMEAGRQRETLEEAMASLRDCVAELDAEVCCVLGALPSAYSPAERRRATSEDLRIHYND